MVNIKEIQEQFDKVIAYSQGLSTVKSDELFDKWLEAKRDIIEAFGGRLIYVYPQKVTFELSQREKELRVSEFIDSVAMTWDNEYLADFIHDNQDGFFKNIVTKSTMVGETKIPEGMKLVKAFKYFESDKEALYQLQNRASMIIQEDKVEGWLCLSVHPLDFLSTSENTYNWRSCHALDGEYRAGNLSYMMDKSTIVCYLRSDRDDCDLPNFPHDVKWNSKKWRMLLFLSDHWNAMMAGRQYPFYSETALNVVQNFVKQALQMNSNWSSWHDDQLVNMEYANGEDETYFNSVYLPLDGRIYNKYELISDCQNPLHFNDLLRSSCYIPYYCWKKRSFHDIHFSIGGDVPCLHCGQHPMAVTDSVLCVECELEFGESEDEMFTTCDCCGRRVLYDETVFVESTGENICQACADNECTSCDCCGDLYYNRDIKYDRAHEDYRCHHCHSEHNDRRERISEWILDSLPF